MKKEILNKERGAYLIIKRNDLIQTTAFNLTKAEYDMLNYIIMKIKPTDNELYPQEIAVQDYCNVMGISAKDNYAAVAKTAKSLSDKSVWALMENEKGVKEPRVVRWIEDPVIKRGKIIVQLKSYLKPYLINVENNYTSMVLQEIRPMKSVYGKRLYELLKSHLMNRKGPIIVTFEIGELKRLLLGEEDYKTKYQDPSNFRKNVIDKGMEDLDEHGDIKATYTFKKEGYNNKYIQFIAEERTLEERIEIWEREKQQENSN